MEARENLAGKTSEHTTVAEEIVIGREFNDERVGELLEKLSPMEQQVLKLYLDGLDYKEIAEALQKSPKSIDNALQRIRRKVR